MYNEKECPVCGCKNEETRYYEEIWGASEVVESYYHCARCSYFDEIVYGKVWPGHKGFYVDDRTVRPDEFLKYSPEELEEICEKSRTH